MTTATAPTHPNDNRTSERLQINLARVPREHVIALAGNPNTGKSTVFNALTGLRQHTGNWPGKTVQRMEGRFRSGNKPYRIVDLPGTYSLLSTSTDEEIARNFLLFGRPDVTVVVADATNLERNLNLTLQIMQITSRVILCVNLIDEAEKKLITIDREILQRDLGIPVVLTAARSAVGLDELKKVIDGVVEGEWHSKPFALHYPIEIHESLERVVGLLKGAYPEIPNAYWVALRLLDGDESIALALASGDFMKYVHDDPPVTGQSSPAAHPASVQTLLESSTTERFAVQEFLHDRFVESLFADARRLAGRAITKKGLDRFWENSLDRLLTSRAWGLPAMVLLLGVIFYLTIEGANIPSRLLADGLFKIEDGLDALFQWLHAPWWLTGFLVHGMYRGLAWVVSVMLPPMAIFFPIFTFLEDFGYLPRVAFNLDRLFKWSGAHGKQALSMGMGFGCNAAGVIATRIIDSPRERLIAIVTNNFVPCNGRWPTLIMLASLFVAAAFPPVVASVAAATTVVGVTVLGVVVTLLVSKFLSSHTSLKGESSFFQIELPPYRRPQFLRILYTSLIDRTLLVLWRAIVMAAPAGGVCWILANVSIADRTLFAHLTSFLDPVGRHIGLDGVILLAYVIAIPANEIVVPTIIMGYMAAGQMTELDSDFELKTLFLQNGWTVLTAICLMLFSLLHYPCSTTTMTIWKETRNIKWTVLSNVMPLAIAGLVCFAVALIGSYFL